MRGDLRLTVSTGGPLVTAGRLPPAVRDAIAPAGRDGPAGGPAAPVGVVREIALFDGFVWAGDAVLSGQCRHVAVATEVDTLLTDAELATREVRCVPDPEDALLSALRRYLPHAEVWQCEPGARCRLGTADGGWYVEASVRRFGTRALPQDLRCAAPNAYEVCVLADRADGSRVRTVQTLDEFPPGAPYLTRRVRVVDGSWQVDVLLSPRFDHDGALAARPTATPFDGPALLAMADAAAAAVREVSVP